MRWRIGFVISMMLLFCMAASAGDWKIQINRSGSIDEYVLSGIDSLTLSDGVTSRYVLDLNGANTSVTVPHESGLNFDGPFTLEAWAMARDYQYPGHQQSPFPVNSIIDKRDDSGFGRGYGLDLDSGYPRVCVATGQSENVAAISAVQIELYQYHHITGSYDGDSLRIFLDGICTGTQYIPETYVIGTGNFVMGSRYSHDMYWWDGQFAGVRVSDICRYVTDFTPPSILTSDANTVAFWPLDHRAGDIAVDESDNGHHGIIANGTWVEWSR
ncbi:MAG: LamG domain-containing protein [Candidatus Eisenbacteria bacterium]|nr:LamG domain-containing protein [Candidatus Eisenbacteria bacterium]